MRKILDFIKRTRTSFDRKFWWFFTNGRKYDYVKKQMKQYEKEKI
jgi:hypothetical protein